MNVGPTGRTSRDAEGTTLTLTREFRAPIEDVWAAVTESDRTARWIGTWRGDPQSGSVVFAMTVEEGSPEQEMEIRECVPPRLLRLTAHAGDQMWQLDLSLEEHDGVTTLTFVQPGIDPAATESIGPGWEYYLDRLVAAETGGDVAAIDFDRDYYPAMVEHYRTAPDRQS
jgi:uncharacterized protein YndB with AHSA1/START domain